MATRKDPKLQGKRLLLIQPLNDSLEPEGPPVVATDGLSTHEGDVVMVVRAREASLAFGHPPVPSDCSIVAKVDALDA